MSLAWGQPDLQRWKRPSISLKNISLKKQIPTRVAEGESRPASWLHRDSSAHGHLELLQVCPGIPDCNSHEPAFERGDVQPEFVLPPYVLSLSGFTGPSLAHLLSLMKASLEGSFTGVFFYSSWVGECLIILAPGCWIIYEVRFMNEISLSGCLVLPNSVAADAVPQTGGPACSCLWSL